MNRYLIIVITLIVIYVHTGMTIYFWKKPKTEETTTIISLLIFTIIGEIVQLVHLIRKRDLNCVSPLG